MQTGPFNYTKSPIAVDRLQQEILNSTIAVALDGGPTLLGTNQLTIAFKADISDDQKTTLDDLIAAHTGVPLTYALQTQPVSIQTQPDPAPFAQPTHRTKRDATDTPITVTKNGVAAIDFKMLVERFVSGGALIIENAEFGDFITAVVEDADGVIPAPYRAALCEAWPTIATYIVKEYVKVRTPGTITAGSVSTHEIDTYPLNAKISAGLYLRLEYHAVNSGLDRRIVVNYNLTKKL